MKTRITLQKKSAKHKKEKRGSRKWMKKKMKKTTIDIVNFWLILK